MEKSKVVDSKEKKSFLYKAVPSITIVVLAIIFYKGNASGVIPIINYIVVGLLLLLLCLTVVSLRSKRLGIQFDKVLYSIYFNSIWFVIILISIFSFLHSRSIETLDAAVVVLIITLSLSILVALFFLGLFRFFIEKRREGKSPTISYLFRESFVFLFPCLDSRLPHPKKESNKVNECKIEPEQSKSVSKQPKTGEIRKEKLKTHMTQFFINYDAENGMGKALDDSEKIKLRECIEAYVNNTNKEEIFSHLPQIAYNGDKEGIYNFGRNVTDFFKEWEKNYTITARWLKALFCEIEGKTEKDIARNFKMMPSKNVPYFGEDKISELIESAKKGFHKT